MKNERKIEMYTKIQILFPFDSYSRKGLTILILQQVYGRLSYLAEFKHRLIGCLFVDHANSRQYFKLVLFPLHRKFIKCQQDYWHFLGTYVVLEYAEEIFLLKQVETDSSLLLLLCASAIDIYHPQVRYDRFFGQLLESVEHCQ